MATAATQTARSLGRKMVVPPIPPGKVQRGESIIEASAPALEDEAASTSCFIEYVDRDGEPSSRVITMRSIAGDFGSIETIRAFCHLRGALREFRIDSVQAMFCAYTGEELDPMEHCLAIARNGALKIENRPLVRIMRIVTFMARCDREFHTLEAEALEDILGRYFRSFGGDDAAYDCARREAVRLAPTGKQALSAVNYLRRLPHSDELARFAIRAAAEMIDADGRHHPQEVHWGVELGTVLRQIAGRRQ